jgi:hypothetical protein
MSAFPVQWFRPEDSARLFRMLIRPVLIGIAIVAIVAILLFSSRSLAPFVIGGGIGNPSHFAMMSDQRESEERQLQEETRLLLNSFENPGSTSPSNAPAESP